MIDDFEDAMEEANGQGLFGNMKNELGSELNIPNNDGIRPTSRNRSRLGDVHDDKDPFGDSGGKDGEKRGSVAKIQQVNSFSTMDPTWNMIRILANDFGDQCSLHGIYALFSKRSIPAKILWAVAILSMNGLFFFYFYDLLRDAVLRDPPATTTSLSYDQQRVVHFPRLSICDPSPDMEKIDEFFEYDAGPMMRFLLALTYSPMFTEFKNDARVDIAQAIADHPEVQEAFSEIDISNVSAAHREKYRIAETLQGTLEKWKEASQMGTHAFDDTIGSTIQFYNHTGPGLDQLIKFCLWKGNDCMSPDSWTRTLTNGGFCWIFDPADDEVFTAGQSQALHLIMDTEAERGSAIMHNYLGVSLDIKDRSKMVSVSDDSQQILLAPGISYLLSFQISEFMDKSDTVDCIFEGSGGHLRYFPEYSFPACIDECLADAEMETCGCRELGLPYPEDQQPAVCNMFQAMLCNMNKTNILRNCYRQCKPQCDFSRYDFQISFGTFPAPLAAEYNMPVFFGNDTEYEYMKDNMIELRMFLDDMFIMKSNVQRQYETFSIISSAGGLAGLFTGASMLTVFEIIELLVSILHLLLVRLSHKMRSYAPQRNERDSGRRRSDKGSSGKSADTVCTNGGSIEGVEQVQEVTIPADRDGEE